MIAVCVQEEMGQSQEMVIADCVCLFRRRWGQSQGMVIVVLTVCVQEEMEQSQEMVIADCVCSGGDGAVPGDGDC